MVKKVDEEMIAEIDLYENAVYVVSGGKIQPVITPLTGYGKQEIVWQKGEPKIGEITIKQKF